MRLKSEGLSWAILLMARDAMSCAYLMAASPLRTLGGLPTGRFRIEGSTLGTCRFLPLGLHILSLRNLSSSEGGELALIACCGTKTRKSRCPCGKEVSRSSAEREMAMSPAGPRASRGVMESSSSSALAMPSLSPTAASLLLSSPGTRGAPAAGCCPMTSCRRRRCLRCLQASRRAAPRGEGRGGHGVR